MKLVFACLCIDCDEIFSCEENNGCPACGSEQVVPLKMWIKPLLTADKIVKLKEVLND
jgi:hypothetical protein